MANAQTARRPRADSESDIQELTQLRDQYDELSKQYGEAEELYLQLEDEKDALMDQGGKVMNSIHSQDPDAYDRLYDELAPSEWE